MYDDREDFFRNMNFKTVMRGFNKNDVQTVVKKLAMMYEEKIASLEEQLEDDSIELESMRNCIAKQEREIGMAREEIEKLEKAQRPIFTETIDRRKQSERATQDVLDKAKMRVESLLADAGKRRDALLSEAEIEVSRAKKNADSLLQNAYNEAGRIKERNNTQNRAWLYMLMKIQKQIAETISEVEEMSETVR
ncbi:MAG: hypothetical protein RR224_05190 [Clostridia bacterium]